MADLLRVLKHLKFALNVAFFVRHEYFRIPKSGNLQQVSQETVHIYTKATKGEIFEILKGFLSNPWNLAKKSSLNTRKTILKAAFKAPLAYD